MQFLSVTIFILTLSLNLFSGDKVAWQKYYDTGRYKAKQLNKDVFLYITTKKDNPSCEYMNKDVLSDDEIVEYINKDYVAIKLYEEEHLIPHFLEFFTVPTIYLLDNQGKEIHTQITGDVNVEVLKNILHKLYMNRLREKYKFIK